MTPAPKTASGFIKAQSHPEMVLCLDFFFSAKSVQTSMENVTEGT
jgi:hypothetical protein